MMKLFKILFFNSMVIGTFIAISAFSWLSIWIGLEINILSLIPLLKNMKNKFPSEAAMKYFIVQAMASSLLLFSVMMFLKTNNSTIEYKTSTLESMMVSSTLLLKMGAAPFHFWLPEVMSGLSWTNLFILLTWQKIAPMMLLMDQIKMYTLLFSIIIVASSMISSLQGLNQINLRKILAYSSINHLSWMISSILNSLNTWNYYFSIYCFINMNIILILNKYNIYYMNQLTNIFTFSKKIKFLFMMNFLSLGGLPPFLGFLPKWMTINNMIDNNHYILTTMLIIFTLISLYFYLRITFSSLTINSEESLIILFNKINYFYFLTNLFSIFGLIACTFIDSNF
uniref:NADH-ubiquinone oxidoreductase chain 2 n=1 Tax=Dichotrachelus manueli TaxID=1315750 RepID=A0A3G2JZG0_9CUCU|nr:NADH dehydrogenase subunit 2 [Dichotrachelus manueli]